MFGRDKKNNNNTGPNASSAQAEQPMASLMRILASLTANRAPKAPSSELEQTLRRLIDLNHELNMAEAMHEQVGPRS